jgi:hypothetical protein
MGNVLYPASAGPCLGSGYTTKATSNGNPFASVAACAAYMSANPGQLVSCTRVGGSGNDTLANASSGEVVCGFGGNDTMGELDGGTFYGGAGDDTLELMLGGVYDGGLGTDSVEDCVDPDGTLVSVEVGSCPLSISGRAWQDANENGIQDAGEAGLADVDFELYSVPGGDLITNATSIGSDGTYAMIFSGGLPAGNYELRVAAPSGWLLSANDQGSDDTIDSDFDPLTGFTSQFGSPTANLDFDAGFRST